MGEGLLDAGGEVIGKHQGLLRQARCGEEIGGCQGLFRFVDEILDGGLRVSVVAAYSLQIERGEQLFGALDARFGLLPEAICVRLAELRREDLGDGWHGWSNGWGRRMCRRCRRNRLRRYGRGR